MSTRDEILSAHQRARVHRFEDRWRAEKPRLSALKQAASKGWADLSAGRFADVEDGQLEDFIGQLGRQAATKGSTSAA